LKTASSDNNRGIHKRRRLVATFPSVDGLAIHYNYVRVNSLAFLDFNGVFGFGRYGGSVLYNFSGGCPEMAQLDSLVRSLRRTADRAGEARTEDAKSKYRDSRKKENDAVVFVLKGCWVLLMLHGRKMGATGAPFLVIKNLMYIGLERAG